MKPRMNDHNYLTIMKSITAQMGQSTETVTYTPGASIEESVATMYQQLIQIADTQMNMLGPGMDPATFVDIFVTNYVRSGQIITDLEDMAANIVPVQTTDAEEDVY